MSTQQDIVATPETDLDRPSAKTKHQIASRRQELYGAMRDLESSIARPSGKDGWDKAVYDALGALHSALQRHVLEIEEEDGLFAEVVGRAPHLAADVEVLRKDHDDLLVSCRVASSLIEGWASPAEIRRKVLGILGRLAIHRQLGAELLYDAYNVDFAASD